MAKGTKTVFFCKECGYESAKWLGHCPGCEAWNSFVEEKVNTNTDKNSVFLRAECKKLKDIQTAETVRYLTGYEELDRVLGGGIVDGSLILFGGEPGIRKIYINTSSM